MAELNSELLTVEQLAERLQVTPRTARELYRRGRIPGLKLGHRTLRFNLADVIEALNERRTA